MKLIVQTSVTEYTALCSPGDLFVEEPDTPGFVRVRVLLQDGKTETYAYLRPADILTIYVEEE